MTSRVVRPRSSARGIDGIYPSQSLADSANRSRLAAMYIETFRQMKKQLGQLDKWLDSATAFAQKKSFDPNLFLGFRLAPDQFAFARQVQTACDSVKLAAARLSGKEAPAHP